MASIDLNRNKRSFGLNNPDDKQQFFSLGMTSDRSENHRTYVPQDPQTNKEYFEKIRDERRKEGGRFDTPELAAEAHYAWAREDASRNGTLGFIREVISVLGYGGLKMKLGPFRQLLKTGEGEVSPPSINQVLSGLGGAVDGLKDNYNNQDGLLNYDYNKKENRREARTDEHGRGGHSDNDGFEGNRFGGIC